MYNIQIAQKRPQNFVQNYNRKRLDKLGQTCYNIIKIRELINRQNRVKEFKVMKIKLMKIKEATRENISEIRILDIQSATIYESAREFFQYNKNAKECFAMLAAHDYTVAEILSYSKEIQEKSRYRLMIDTLDRLIEDDSIICYTGLEILD